MRIFKKFLGGDWTPLEHAAYAVFIQAAVLLCLWHFTDFALALSVGTAAAIAFFCGREHAQAEDRLRPSLGQPGSELAALLFWRWDRGSQMDLYCPAVAALLVALLVAVAGL